MGGDIRDPVEEDGVIDEPADESDAQGPGWRFFEEREQEWNLTYPSQKKEVEFRKAKSGQNAAQNGQKVGHLSSARQSRTMK
jgi:hypothetical protein